MCQRPMCQCQLVALVWPPNSTNGTLFPSGQEEELDSKQIMFAPSPSHEPPSPQADPQPYFSGHMVATTARLPAHADGSQCPGIHVAVCWS